MAKKKRQGARKAPNVRSDLEMASGAQALAAEYALKLSASPETLANLAEGDEGEQEGSAARRVCLCGSVVLLAPNESLLF